MRCRQGRSRLWHGRAPRGTGRVSARRARRRTGSLGAPRAQPRAPQRRRARASGVLAVPFRLDDRVRDRIVAETRGNPLALSELPRGLTVTQLAGGFGRTPLGKRCRRDSRRASNAGSSDSGSCPTLDAGRRRRTSRRPVARLACSRETRDREHRGRRGHGWFTHHRGIGEVLSSTRSLCGVPIRTGGTASGGAYGAGGGDRSGGGSRPSGVASRCGNAQPGRRRRSRAGAIRRPRASTRWRCRRKACSSCNAPSRSRRTLLGVRSA